MTSEHEPSLEAFLEEHRDLLDVMSKIDKALEARTATLAEVAQLLGQLGDRLVKHFAFEEEGGYLGEALLHAPRLVAKANELLAQHPQMVQFTRDMVREIDEVEHPSEQWWAETHRKFREFQELLIRHEREENTLVQDAFSTDLGAND